MTTIAYRAGVMAADTGSLYGDSKIAGVTKLAIGPDGAVYGTTGNASLARVFLDWVRSGYRGEQPTIPLDRDGNNEIVVLRADPTGRLELITHFGAEDMSGFPYMAVGADAPIALGAMFIGAPATKAVSAAIEHGRWTSGQVFEMPVGKPVDA